MDFELFRPRAVVPEFAKCLNCARFRVKTEGVSVSVQTPGFSQWELIPHLIIDINSELFKARYVGEEKRNSLILKPLFTPFPIDVTVDPLHAQNLSVAAKSQIDISSDVPSMITCNGRFESVKRKGSVDIVLDATLGGWFCLIQSGLSGVLFDRPRDATVFLGLAAGVPVLSGGFRTKANVKGVQNTLMARLSLPFVETRVRVKTTEKFRLRKAECSGTMKYENLWLKFASEQTKLVYNIEAGAHVRNCTLKLATDSDKFVSAKVAFPISPSGKVGLWGGWNFHNRDRPRFGISFTARD